MFLMTFFLLPSQGKSEEKPTTAVIAVPDGPLEELRDFVVKYDRESQRLMTQRLLQADRTAPAEAVRSACEKILADPVISDEFRLWTLKKKAQAQIMLAYADPSRYFSKLLAAVDDYEEQEGCEDIVKTVETYILDLGTRIATAPRDPDNPKPLKLDFDAFVERLLIFLEAHPEPGSKLLVTDLITRIKATPPVQRDRMMLVVAERLAPYYLKSKEANDRDFGRKLQATARLLSLPGKPMLLEGVQANGELFDPDTLKGKVVLVQFWQMTCAPCRAEMPIFVKLLEQYGKKGFEVIGVCTQGGTKAVRDFLDRTALPDGNRITWPILVDESAPKAERLRLTEYYNITETPVLVLIGRDGNVVRVNPLPSALELEIGQALYPQMIEAAPAGEHDL